MKTKMIEYLPKKYYVPNIEIKGYIFVINGKIFFDIPIKKIEETCEKITRMSKIDNYTTNNLLDYFSNHYNLIAIDLSRRFN